MLEYCDVIYDNSPAYLKIQLENVQRKAALLCTGAYRHTETRLLLDELTWTTLGKRRHDHKLALFYKIYHNIYPSYLRALFPPLNAPNYRLRVTPEFKLPIYRLNATIGSFFPSTAKVWNTLSPPIKDSPSITIFKRHLTGPKKRTNMFFNSCTGKKGIWITRMRLGLSPLNYQRFRYNLVSEPYCPHCPNTLETVEHFILECPYYATPRITYLQKLTDIGININDKKKTINEILYRLSFKTSPEVILDPTKVYLSVTNRFK